MNYLSGIHLATIYHQGKSFAILEYEQSVVILDVTNAPSSIEIKKIPVSRMPKLKMVQVALDFLYNMPVIN